MDKNSTVGIIGAGTMGTGIAQLAAQAGHSTLLFDTRQEALDSAKTKLAKVMARLVEKGRLNEVDSSAIQNRIHYATDLKEFAPCGLVIEAIVEDLAIKQKVFNELEKIVSAECILATNTSSLSVTAIAGGVQRPEQVIGLHFFNPAPLLPLVEVVPGLASDPKVVDAVYDQMKAWNKTPVKAKDTPGFIVNRVARPFYGEAIRIYEEGIADIPTIDRAMKEYGGFRMGPFELMDLIGNDVNFVVTETVFKEFFYDQRYKPSFTQKRLVEAGWFGRKSGKGYYDYGADAKNPAPSEDGEQGKELLFRVLVMLINEAVDALNLHIADRDDIDLAMTKGVNYPKGLLAWADEIGLSKVLSKLENLQELYGEDRYRPSPLLKQMVAADRSFY